MNATEIITTLIPTILFGLSLLILIISQIKSNKKVNNETQTTLDIIAGVTEAISPMVTQLFNNYINYYQSAKEEITYDELKEFIIQDVIITIEGVSDDILPSKYREILMKNNVIIETLLLDPILTVIWKTYLSNKD